MSQNLKGFTINEGYTDLGTISVNISKMENPVVPSLALPNVPASSRAVLVQIVTADDLPVPDGMKVVFTVDTPATELNVVYTTYTAKGGFVGFEAPIMPIVKQDAEGGLSAQIKIIPAYESRSQECYLELDEAGAALYTLSGYLGVSARKLGIFTDDDTFYPLAQELPFGIQKSALYISSYGEVFVYDTVTNSWEGLDTLQFTQFSRPENLTSPAEGVYQSNAGTGTITQGSLGEGTFEGFSLSVLNPDIYYFDANIKVYEDGNDEPIYEAKLNNLLPGDRNYKPVTIDYTPPVQTDNSPNLEDIETISGVTFSSTFKDFLEEEELTTLNALRAVGPIKYITGIPDTISADEIALLQSHTDFYSVNPSIAQNQLIISAGYGSLYQVSLAPKNTFINDVMDEEDLGVFEAAQIHEVALRQSVLFSNLISGAQVNSRFEADWGNGYIARSTYGQTFLANFASSCSCEDCKSAVSPFAYFVDLIKYAAAHVKHATYPYSPSSNYNRFLNLITETFYQPFGQFPVTCDMLHDEYCRVRLATEVLESHLQNVSISPAHAATLFEDRKKYLQLTYTTLLAQIGTSLDEVRDVYITQEPEKQEKSQKLAQKLGIPAFVSGNSTTDALWLYFTDSYPNPADEHDLNAENLEKIFGYRDILRSPLQATPVSDMETWHNLYLRQVWKDTDYPLTAYTREASPDPSLVKRPMVDPDIMGTEDLTYIPKTELFQLWKYRKEYIDSFLNSFVTAGGIVSQAGIDSGLNRILIKDANIIGHVMEDNTVYLRAQDVDPWDDFEITNKTQSDSNVIFTLDAVPPVSEETNPAMRYDRRIHVNSIVETPASSGTYVLTLKEDATFPLISTGSIPAYAKLLFIDNTSVETSYDTTSGDLVDVSFQVLGGNKVQFEFGVSAVVPDPTFANGTLHFIYTAEVSRKDILPDPEKIVASLFTEERSYTYLGYPAQSPPQTAHDYWVWEESSTDDYAYLKTIQAQLSLGNNYDTHVTYINDQLHMDLAAFTRMMQLFAASESYINNPVVSPRPSTADLYELASIIFNSAKANLFTLWVTEENTEYYENNGLGSYSQVPLYLNREKFWISLQQPSVGSWDGSLQQAGIPVIDPELLKEVNLLDGHFSEEYKVTYAARKTQLEGLRTTYLSYLYPAGASGFTSVLNALANNGNPATPYNIAPYTNLTDLVDKLNSPDYYTGQSATDKVQAVFGLSKDDFIQIYKTQLRYIELPYGQATPLSELKEIVNLCVSAHKRKWLYGAWKTQETTDSVKYFLVMKMKMAEGRSNFAYRAEWQRTLRAWSKQPVIDPDFVRPENIVNYLSSAPNIVRDIWTYRYQTVIPSIEAEITTLFNKNLSYINQWNGYRKALATYLFGYDPNFSGAVSAYYRFFTDLKAFEDVGEDIRPRLEQINITSPQYRVLRKIYDILESTYSTTIPLGEEEYTQAVDILVQATKLNKYFPRFILKEFEENIILSGKDFIEYKPPVNTFPLTELPQYNETRAPFRTRKDWFDLLESRNERKQIMEQAWEKVLMDTEEKTLRVLRDAIIRALARDCESLEDAAERLARTLFVETKDNCCTRHTRISFAIETIQKFIFALKNGIYDDYIDDFALIAPNFDQEWEWIGSYATWRAAVFTWLYPENLLYPTLKRLKSPAFGNLSQSLQDANRLTPDSACQLAKEYEDYLEDVLNLDIKFTVTVPVVTYVEDNNGCCGDQTHYVDTDFYFAKSRTSGRCYWSGKQHWKNTADAHGFWELIPDMEKSNIIGCFPLPVDRKSPDPDYVLWLFYTYREKGELKMAYRKRNVNTARTAWGDHTDTDDVPTEITVPNGASESVDKNLGNPYSIIACQSSLGWDYPSFIFSYNDPQNINPSVDAKFTGSYHLHFRYRDEEGKWDMGTPQWFVCEFFNYRNVLPIMAVRHSDGNNLYAVSIGFENQILTRTETSFTPTIFSPEVTLAGLYQSREHANTLIWVVRNSTWQNTAYKKSFNGLGNIDFPTQIPCHLGSVVKMAPTFSIYQQPCVFAMQNSNHVWISGEMKNTETSLVPVNKVSLTPEGPWATTITPVPIQSAECITDYDWRSTQVKNFVIANEPPQPWLTDSLRFTRSMSSVEYIKEAYYFVPMLLALDQQQRGQYDAALDWYRSIYNYTQFPSLRKIYYGLKQEESLVNVYNRPSDWLLDPLNPHLIAATRRNAYTRYTLMNIIQCLLAYADQEFTIDTIESVPRARILYSTALDLIESVDLKQKPDACIKESSCLLTNVAVADSTWSNLAAIMVNDFGGLNNTVVLQSVKEQIENIFSSEELDNYVDRFSEAVLVIEEAREVKATSDITGVMNGQITRFDEGMSYMNALSDTSLALNDITQFVNERYGVAIAQVSGIEVSQLPLESAAGKLSWLVSDVPTVKEPYTFEFASASGVQNFAGAKGFNPLAPTGMSFNTNLTLTNAAVWTSKQPNFPIRPAYTPIIDYVFCIPTNPVYDSLELKANLELYKIHNCRNIAGMVRELDVYAAPTDSVTGIPVIGAGGNLVLPGLTKFRPSQYHFRVLIDRAKQITSQAQQLESLFLSAMEKRDAEYYNQLKARQDLETSKSTIKLQDLRVKQANDEKRLSEIQLDKSKFSEENFNNLLSAGLTAYEQISIEMLYMTVAFQAVSATLSFSSPSAAIDFGASGMSSLASAFATTSSILSQYASYARRAQEWDYQRQLAGYDVKLANQQIKISEDNIRIVAQEREIAQLNADHAQDTLEFLRNKFTNAELYNWMSNVLERTYAYMLNLATSIAKTAEGQLYFERQEQAGPFILDDYWESPGDSYTVSGAGSNAPDRRGLTGSARLLQDIYRLDQYAFDTEKRKLQLTKTISLAQNFPVEFQQFKETGVLNFELTNKMVDYDFPGHYLRLIRGVKTTVVGLVPVYGGIKATLTADATSYTVVGDTFFQSIPVKKFAIDSVALTSPNNSNGLFEMQQVQGELLNPFEGMGFESRWEFKMPRFSNRMDYSQVADVLINVEYTALDSFQYRAQVLQDMGQNADENFGGDNSFNRAFSFKNNFPDQWFELANMPDGVNLGSSFSVTFKTRKEDFPQGLNKISVQDITLFFAREDGVDEINVANFTLIPSNPTMVQISASLGTTTNGLLSSSNANGLSFSPILAALGTNEPFVTWKLEFANTPQNRQLFSEEKVKDILFVLTCKGELPAYPL